MNHITIRTLNNLNRTQTNCMHARLYCTNNLFNVAHQNSVNEGISLPKRWQRNNSSKTNLTQVSNEKKSKWVYSSIVGSNTKKKTKAEQPSSSICNSMQIL